MITVMCQNADNLYLRTIFKYKYFLITAVFVRKKKKIFIYNLIERTSKFHVYVGEEKIAIVLEINEFVF